MFRLNDIETGKKLIGAFAIVAAVLIAVAFVGYSSTKNTDDNTNAMYDDNMIPYQQIGALDRAQEEIRGSLYRFALFPDERATQEASVTANIKAGDDAIAAYQGADLGQDEKDQLALLEPAWDKYKQTVNDALTQAKAGDAEKVLVSGFASGGALHQDRAALDAPISKLKELQIRAATDLDSQSDQLFSNSTIVQFGAGLVGLLLALGLGLFISRNITGRLSQVTAISQQISQTDLPRLAQSMGALASGELSASMAVSSQTLNLKSRDEIGQLAQAFNQIVERLQQVGASFTRLNSSMSGVIRDIIEVSGKLAAGDLTATPQAEYLGELARIRDGLKDAQSGLRETMRQTSLVVSEVSQSVDQVRSVSQDLASNSQEQSAAVEEVSSSVERTSEQVKSSADNAGSANQLANQTTQLAQTGQMRMQSLSKAMNAIADSSREIGKIIKVIDDIAFQTNLLALNAAVEAARAGQAGRGFAVVAQEVRNLAERSATAAKSTAELIDQASRRTEEGVKITSETDHALAEIVQNVVKVKDLVGEMAAASEEQTHSLSEITRAMGQLNQGAQSSSSQSEELASTADELGGLAGRLRVQVQRFRLEEETESSAGPQSRPGPAENASQVNPSSKDKKAKFHLTDPKPSASAKATAGNGHRLSHLDRDERGYGAF